MLSRTIASVCLLLAALAVSANAAPGKPPIAGQARTLGAREVAALADMTAIRDAEIMAYLDTDYLFSLEDLDDLLTLTPPTYYFDDIMYGGGAQAISVQTGNFLPYRLDVRLPYHHWGGPYVTYQQGHISIDGAGYDPGTPIDPWGNPYYLFSPLGLVRPTLGTVTLELYGDRFDRWTLVSLGADGVMSDDDIIFQFEGTTFGPPNAITITSLVPDAVAPGQTVTVRGYHFGATQGASQLQLADRTIGTITSWSDRTISFRVPVNATGGQVVVVGGASRSNPFLLHVLTAAHRWTRYR